MKKVAFALLLVASLASPALATEFTLTFGAPPGTGFGPYQNNSGGEFTATPNGAPWLDLSAYSASSATRGVTGAPNSFQTFCIETTETVSAGQEYHAEINPDGAVGGGYQGGNPDPISQGTGWLYSQFAAGTLAGYNYGAGRLGSADLLQRTIWWLEQEDPAYYGSVVGTTFYNAVAAQFTTAANARLGSGADYGVYAINLWTSSIRTERQDMLIAVPDGGATLMLLGGALMAMGALRRRFRA